jgi:hypothetical protein
MKEYSLYRFGRAEHAGPQCRKLLPARVSHMVVFGEVLCFFFFFFFLMKCCVFCDHNFFSQNWAYLFFFNEKSAKNRVRSLSIGRGSQETLSRAA